MMYKIVFALVMTSAAGVVVMAILALVGAF